MFLKIILLSLFIFNLAFGQTINSTATNNELFSKSYINKNNLNLLSFNLYYSVENEELFKEQELMFKVIEYLGTPYRYGGHSKNGIDCSAFTQTVYYNAYEITLPRTAANQFDEGISVEKDSLKFGDLVFFKTSKRKYVGHVGIYLDSGKFVHSGRKKGVSIADINDKYYSKKFIGGRRIK